MARNLISYWSTRDVVVLFATMACGAALWRPGRAVRPRLTLLPIVGLYELLLNAALFIIALQPVPNHGYWFAYWYGGTCENLLICLLAIEITSALLPRKQFVLAWCTAAAVLLLLSAVSTLPARTEAALMRGTLAMDFIAAAVLATLIYFPEIEIPRPYRFIIAGILLPAAVHAAATFQWLTAGLAEFAQAALPLSSLIGLVLFLSGARIAKRELQKERGAERSAPAKAASATSWKVVWDGSPELPLLLPSTASKTRIKFSSQAHFHCTKLTTASISSTGRANSFQRSQSPQITSGSKGEQKIFCLNQQLSAIP